MTHEPVRAKVTVIGEAIVDLVPGGEAGYFRACPGGSPYNVAVGLARLGHDTTLMARLADSALGRILRAHAATEGIDLGAAPAADEPATLAVVSLDSEGRASYDFYRDGTADWQWTAAEISRVPSSTAVLHFGSLASWTSPGAEHIAGLTRRLRARGDVLLSYDPNIRPRLLTDRDYGQRMVERSLRVAHLAKASSEDISWLYPGQTTGDVARHWLGLGVSVVVVTDGPNGADAYSEAGPPLHRPALAVEVADTVGAGDAFTAGLLGSFVRNGQHSPAEFGRLAAPLLSAALDDAILVAALTCQRPGADPPARAEFESASVH